MDEKNINPAVRAFLNSLLNNTCGLEPLFDNTKNVIETYLEKLLESQVCQALIEQHTAV